MPVSTFSEQAAKVTGPISAADTTGRTGVIRVAVTTSNASFSIPTAPTTSGRKTHLEARFIRIMATGANVQIAFGAGSAPTLVYNQAAAMGTGHVSAGMMLVANSPEQFLVPREATHLSYIGDASGFLELYVSDQPVI